MFTGEIEGVVIMREADIVQGSKGFSCLKSVGPKTLGTLYDVSFFHNHYTFYFSCKHSSTFVFIIFY